MKNYIYILSSIFLLLMTACTSQNYLTTDAVNQLVEKSEFSFHAKKALINNVDVMNVLNSMPGGGGASRVTNLDEGYGFQIKNNEMNSALPYFGRLYNSSSYGSNDKSGFTFASKDATFTKSQGSKGKWIYKITANDQFNKPTYILEIYKNGSAYLSISANDRQPISYDGYISEFRKID